jgi:predicted dehydrogenase
MSEKKVRWGIISTANIGRAAVIPAIRASRNGEVVAVASRDESRAKAFAEKLSIPRVYGSYEALLAAQDIDAVYIPLPNSMHREWTIRAAEAGKHILCEKPLALNAEECAEMAEAARKHKVLLMEAFMYRFHQRTMRVIELVRAGALGELRFIHAAFTFSLNNYANIRFQPELGGGALMDVGSYCVNIIRTASGAEPVEAQAVARWASTGVDELMVGTLRFADGLVAQFDCSITLDRREEYQVCGTEATIDVPKAFLPGAGDVSFCEHRGRKEDVTHNLHGVDEYQEMVEHFAAGVLEGKPLRYPPAEAEANMRVIDALYRSAKRGSAVEKVS